MRYVNQTKTTLELCDGDVLESDASLIVIGRDRNLAEALQHRTGTRFRPFSNSEFSEQYVQIVRSADRKMAAIRTNFRPNRRSLINFEYGVLREFANAITHLMSVTEMNHIAMAPLSCRVPEHTSRLMVRFVWSLSIIWFLKLRGYPALGADREVKFTIYNLGSVQLFQQAIQSRSYMDSSLSELEVGFDLSCDPPKRMRFQKRNGFPLKPESAPRASSERINVSA